MTTATLITQPSPLPTRKVAAGAIGASGVGIPLAQLIIWLLGTWLGVDITPEVAGAIGTITTAIVGFVASWLVRERAPVAEQ